jgi:hypothetical protein
MDEHTKMNWQKVKEALEKQNKTDCFFYERAVIICNGGPDPIDKNYIYNNDAGVSES